MTLDKRRDDVAVYQHPNDEIGDGSQTVTTAGSRVQLSTFSVGCRSVLITAKVTNNGSIWVGGITIAANRGKPLVPLQDFRVEIDDLNKIYLDSDNNGNGVTYIYVV